MLREEWKIFVVDFFVVVAKTDDFRSGVFTAKQTDPPTPWDPATPPLPHPPKPTTRNPIVTLSAVKRCCHSSLIYA